MEGFRLRDLRGKLLILVVAGIALRLTGLARESLWLDEMTSIEVSRMPLQKILNGEVFDNYTPPLYYALLHLWGRVVPLTEHGLRLFSALVDGINIILLAALCRRYLEKTATVIVVAAYALSPLMIYYSQEGRMYTMAVFWALSHVLSLDIAFRREAGPAVWIWAAISGLCLALGLYTHYYMAFFGAGTYGLAFYCSHRSWVRFAAVGFSAIVAFLIFLPWVPVALEIATTGSQGFRKYVYEVIPYALFRFTVGYAVFPINAGTKENFIGEIVSNLPVLIVVFGILAYLLYRIAKGTEISSRNFLLGMSWIAFLPWIIGFLLSLRSPMLSERYLVPTFPFFLMFLLGKIPRRAIADKIALTAFFLLLICGDWAYFTNPKFGKAQWREAALYVSQEIKPGDVVVVEPPYATGVFQYYFHGTSPVFGSTSNYSFSRLSGRSDEATSALSKRRVILVSSGIPQGEGYSNVLAKKASPVYEKFFPKETGIKCSIWKTSL